MGKVVDGVELLRMIKNKEIKSGTELIRNKETKYVFDGESIKLNDSKCLYDIGTDIFEIFTMFEFIHRDFEILSEEDEEIDIQAIEEFDRPNINLHDLKDVENEIKWLQDAHNKILKAVKKLDKKIKEKEND